MKKAISSIDLGKAALYGAVLAGLWTLIFGIAFWVLGWLFGAQAWFIDMNLGNWTEYTLSTAISVFLSGVVNAAVGAVAGLFVAAIYNVVAGAMGGIVVTLDEAA